MQASKREQQIETKRMHVEKWKESGLNMSQYCQQAGIPVSTFSAWVHDSKPKTSASSAFKRVVMQPTIMPPKSDLPVIEFVIDDRVTVKLHHTIQPDVIASIAKALLSCN